MQGKITTIKRIRLFGDALMFGMFICLFYILLTAYYNGVHKGEFSTIVNINSQGEAHVELILLSLIMLPVFILTLVLSFLDWKNTWNAKERITREYNYFEDEELEPDHKSINIQCPRCKELFVIETDKPMSRTQCPYCGTIGNINLDKLRRESSPQPQSRFETPKIRIIKNIKS